jgi:predicted lipase
MLKQLAKISKGAYSGVFDYKILHTIDKRGVQAYILEVGEACVVVFRGSDEHKDWAYNLQASFTSTVYGKMHKGFKKSWDSIAKELRDNLPLDKNIYFTGHSYGGALAFISGLYIEGTTVTYGCPMVMDKHAKVKVNHIRVRNNNDIVTQLPSLGYKHFGELVYLDYDGKKHSSIKFFDRIKSHLKAWSKGQKFNPFYDHDIDEYLKKL